MIRIFAYGSNLTMARIRARAPSVTARGIGYVTHRYLMFHKDGVDGSGKADAAYTGREEDRVWGVLLEMSPEDKRALDGFEGGYDLAEVAVIRPDGDPVRALTYEARRDCRRDGAKPFAWYLALVVDGARAHGLPEDYIRTVERVPFVPDPDAATNSRHRR